MNRPVAKAIGAVSGEDGREGARQPGGDGGRHLAREVHVEPASADGPGDMATAIRHDRGTKALHLDPGSTGIAAVGFS
jgi:hypothetical protein